MLLTDKETTKKLYDRLVEFSKYGMVLYYMLENGRIESRDLEGIFCSKDDEKSSFLYINLMKRINPIDLEISQEKYIKEEKIDDINRLNLLYTGKLIDTISLQKDTSIDKTYINTYQYLLEDNKEGFCFIRN